MSLLRPALTTVSLLSVSPTVTERFVEVTGSLLSDMVSEGYAYESLDNLSTLLARSSTLVAGTIFGGVLALLCLLFLLWPDPVWPGVEEETDEAGDLPVFAARRPWLDRAVPTDLLVIVAGIVLLCCAAALSDDLNYQFMPGNTIAAALVGSLIFLPTLCSLVRRGGRGRWVKTCSSAAFSIPSAGSSAGWAGAFGRPCRSCPSSGRQACCLWASAFWSCCVCWAFGTTALGWPFCGFY